MGISSLKVPKSVKFSQGGGLLQPNSTSRDFRQKVVLTADWRCAGKAAAHRDLPDVRKGIGDGALEQPFDREAERRLRRKKVVEGLKRYEEPVHLVVLCVLERVGPHVPSAAQ